MIILNTEGITQTNQHEFNDKKYRISLDQLTFQELQLDSYELQKRKHALPSSNKNIGSISLFFFYGKKQF